MPFTFAHPAIVLPLHALQRRCFSLTALVAGSLSPDFEYFLRMQIHSSHIHTLWGLLYFDLPLGLILAFLFHNIVRDPLLDNLPGFLRRRVSVYKTLNDLLKQEQCLRKKEYYSINNLIESMIDFI